MGSASNAKAKFVEEGEWQVLPPKIETLVDRLIWQAQQLGMAIVALLTLWAAYRTRQALQRCRQLSGATPLLTSEEDADEEEDDEEDDDDDEEEQDLEQRRKVAARVVRGGGSTRTYNDMD